MRFHADVSVLRKQYGAPAGQTARRGSIERETPNGLNELRLRVGVQFHVLGDALGFLHLVDDFFEFAFVFTQWKGFKTDSRDAGGQYVGCFLSFLFTLMEMSAAG